MNHDESSFLSAFAPDIDTLYCTKEGDRLAANDKPNSTVLTYRSNDKIHWSRIKPSVGWTAVGMASFVDAAMGVVVFAVSSRGKIMQFGLSAEQAIITSIPNVGSSIRTARTIGDTAWIIGMGRRAFKRLTNGVWVDDSPQVMPNDVKTIIGFEDVDGFTSDDIYAVGWRGEIWHKSSVKWKRLDSPTSRNLNAVCCADDGNVYAVGAKGSFLVGRDDLWRRVDNNIMSNIMDVTYFGGCIFVCTDYAIFKFQNGELIPEDRFEDDRRPATCLHLIRTAGGVFSVGPKDVFRFQAGVWKQVV
ncbi:hypothetical protein [Leptothrix ochracea]|uniref:hypothetical protein n=1 Tax=Leptothrix ochracea TaxID=735331 RepID=UPI0034E1D157